MAHDVHTHIASLRYACCYIWCDVAHQCTAGPSTTPTLLRLANLNNHLPHLCSGNISNRTTFRAQERLATQLTKVYVCSDHTSTGHLGLFSFPTLPCCLQVKQTLRLMKRPCWLCSPYCTLHAAKRSQLGNRLGTDLQASCYCIPAA